MRRETELMIFSMEAVSFAAAQVIGDGPRGQCADTGLKLPRWRLSDFRQML
jgi:hypothetical protein